MFVALSVRLQLYCYRQHFPIVVGGSVKFETNEAKLNGKLGTIREPKMTMFMSPTCFRCDHGRKGGSSIIPRKKDTGQPRRAIVTHFSVDWRWQWNNVITLPAAIGFFHFKCADYNAVKPRATRVWVFCSTQRDQLSLATTEPPGLLPV